MSETNEIINLESAIAQAKSNEDEIDFSPVVAYLSTKNGHEVATEVISIFKDKMNQSTKVVKLAHILDQISKILLVATVIGCATYLSATDKFTATVSLLMGTVVGFVFGKKSS